MMQRLALVRDRVRVALLPINQRKALNSSHGSGPLSTSTDDIRGSAKTALTRCLIEQGIPGGESEAIVSLLPNRHIDQEEVHRTLSTLSSLQFGQERLAHLLKTHPGLILANSNQISKSYANLSSIFSQNYVYKILFNSPNVVEQRRSELAEKINYLNKVLGIPNSHIVNSSALSYTIAHIKVRSEFLKRCGILKTTTKKDAVMTVVDLSDMFDTADLEFATKVAKLTPIEYEAFKNMYSMEEDSESESASDSDSD